MSYDRPHVEFVSCELLTKVIVVSNDGLIFNFDVLALVFELMYIFLQSGNAGGILKLKEASLQHVFWRDSLYSDEVENHVVAKMERRIQIVLRAPNDFFGDSWLHF